MIDSFPAVLAVTALLLPGAALGQVHPNKPEPTEQTAEKSDEYCYFRGQKYSLNAYVRAYPNRGMVCNPPKNAKSFAEWGMFTDGSCK